MSLDAIKTQLTTVHAAVTGITTAYADTPAQTPANADFVALSGKVNTQLNTINTAVTNAIAAVKPQDGGAAAFTAFQSALASWPGTPTQVSHAPTTARRCCGGFVV